MGISEQSGNLIASQTRLSKTKTMGRGAVSKSIRAQNRAELAGNPSRGNPHADGHANGRRRRKKTGVKDGFHFQKMIVLENKHYRVGYNWDGTQLTVAAIVHYYNPSCSISYLVIDGDDPIVNVICMKLLITLRVEDAQR
tara:strand:+ start:100 stop:519 length:420 start_codon:yes stop_codon:yes gene_type:complete